MILHRTLKERAVSLFFIDGDAPMILRKAQGRLWKCDNNVATQVKFEIGSLKPQGGQGGICMAYAIVWAQHLLAGKSPMESKPSQLEASLKMSRYDTLEMEGFKRRMTDGGLKIVHWKVTPSYRNARDWMLGRSPGGVYLVMLGRNGKSHVVGFVNVKGGNYVFDPNFGMFQFSNMDDIRTAFIGAAEATGLHPADVILITQVEAA